MKVVVDTNVFISRILSPLGPPARVFEAWRQDQFTVAVSEPILTEFERVLAYPHIRSRHGLSDAAIADVVEGFRQVAEVVVPSVSIQVVTDDPDDDKFIECAVESGADYIVSGDKHLLVIGEYAGIRILRPSEFLLVLPLMND